MLRLVVRFCGLRRPAWQVAVHPLPICGLAACPHAVTAGVDGHLPFSVVIWTEERVVV